MLGVILVRISFTQQLPCLAQSTREYLRSMDWDKNGRVEYDDFRLFMARMMCSDQGDREMEMAFQVRAALRSLASLVPANPC